jgi:hypothetical protein
MLNALILNTPQKSWLDTDGIFAQYRRQTSRPWSLHDREGHPDEKYVLDSRNWYNLDGVFALGNAVQCTGQSQASSRTITDMPMLHVSIFRLSLANREKHHNSRFVDHQNQHKKHHHRQDAVPQALCLGLLGRLLRFRQ